MAATVDPDCAYAGATPVFPDSTSRRSRFKSTATSAALW
jgi:hypothetical protein